MHTILFDIICIPIGKTLYIPKETPYDSESWPHNIHTAYPAICMDIQTHPYTYSRFLVKTSFYYLHHHQRHGNSSFFLVCERIILKVCCTENISILYTTLARDAWIYANKYKDVKTSVVWGCAWGNYISKLHHTAS